MSLWLAVLATSAGCYALKLAGLTVPRRLLDHPKLRRCAELLPVALLAALCAAQALAAGQSLTFDGPRLAGLAAAVAALRGRAPFIVVLAAAAAVTAGLRAAGHLIGH
ncbi:MAG TPA: AzlD domain-containing protein [Streptosporangiaceae bacterium]|nr:AzlD domain-containing protein [Streptosporangiaceae bacterium]